MDAELEGGWGEGEGGCAEGVVLGRGCFVIGVGRGKGVTLMWCSVMRLQYAGPRGIEPLRGLR